MTRRAALLAIFTTAIGKYDIFSVVTHAQGKAVLTIDLSNWSGLHVRQGKKDVFIGSKEIFDCLQGEVT